MKRDRLRIFGNLVLVVLGLALIVYYIACDDACAYLKGSILGVDLKYIGVVLMLTMGGLALFRQWSYLRVLLAGSLGVEIYLIGFQIQQDIYCPYCLVLAALIVAAFLVNYERPDNIRGLSFLGVARFDWPRPLGPVPLSLFALAGFLFVMLTFSGSVLPVYGIDSRERLFTFGNSRSEIRIYTDYFCGPCRSIEPAIEDVLIQLVHRGDYRVTFVDMPFHAESVVYVTQFLHALNAEGGDIAHAIRVRRLLFDLAGKGVTQEEALRQALKEKKIKLKPYDVRQTFSALNRFIREDRVNSTPCCVIVRAGLKTRYVGSGKVRDAIVQLGGPVKVPAR